VSELVAGFQFKLHVTLVRYGRKIRKFQCSYPVN